MTVSLYVIFPTLIGIFAVVIAIVSFLDGRKRTRLLETMIKTLPYTSSKKKAPTTTTRKRPKNVGTQIAQTNDIKRMRLELEQEKIQWQKNKDIAKGIAWIIEHLNSDEEEY